VRENTAMGRRHTVAVLATDGTAPFELAVACEVFGIDRSDHLGVPWYRFMVVAGDEPPIRTKAGFSIDTPYRLADLRRADTIVVPMWYPDEEPRPELLDALRAAHARGTRMLSVCSGAFLLAAAGLLDGRRATTHWMFTDDLAARYPRVRVDPGVLYVDDGDVLTSAGTAAGIDLCLHVVRKDHGAEIANAVARRMVVPPHRDGGQAQYIADPVPPCTGTDLFTDTMTWMLEHLDEQVTVEDLAERSAMSPRTFARRFRAVTGTTPLQWVLRQRVLLAQRLLETTDEPVERIATQCGFGTAAGMRQHFTRFVHTTPQAYRRTFRREAG